MSLASLPTAITSPVFLWMATMEGSLTSIPLPLEKHQRIGRTQIDRQVGRE